MRLSFFTHGYSYKIIFLYSFWQGQVPGKGKLAETLSLSLRATEGSVAI